MSKKYTFLDASVNTENNIVIATMKKPPVNSFSCEFIEELSELLEDLENDKTEGLIFVSEYNEKSFSAGLDLNELVQGDSNRLMTLMKLFTDFAFKLINTSYPTVAVINGHAPAGGSLIPFCCEYRIMLNNFTIGLNELQFGLCLKEWLTALMVSIIGNRKTELAVLSGKLFTSEEAFKEGLIDEIASNYLDAMEKAGLFLSRSKIVDRPSRLATKQMLRRTVNDTFQKSDADEGITVTPTSRRLLMDHITRIKARKFK